MITCYAGSEVTGKPEVTGKTPPEVQVHWLEPITFFRHDRDITFNRNIVVEALAAIKGEGNPQRKTKKPGGTYCHYCPYQRIFNAIQDYCLGRSRGEVLFWLFGKSPRLWLAGQAPGQGGQAVQPQDPSVLGKLGIRPTGEAEVVLKACGDPLKSVLAFDVWLEWAIYSICDWPQNMFFGYGQGDGRGTLLDEPNPKTNKYADVQLKRVKAAFTRLLDAIPTLSSQGKVSVEKYTKIYTKAGEKELGDLAHMSADDATATLQITGALENSQIEAGEASGSKKRKIEATAIEAEHFEPDVMDDGTLD